MKYNKRIEQIMSDLYELDPELKKHEDILMGVIKKIIKQKPEVKIDKQFREELYLELSKIIDEDVSRKKSSLISFFQHRNFVFATSVAVIVLVVIVTFASHKNIIQENGNFYDLPSDNLAFNNSLSIEKTGKSQFGNLANFYEARSLDESSPKGLGGGGGYGTASLAENRMIVAPLYYTYKYIGEDFDLNESEAEVYKRLKGGSGARLDTSLLSRISMDIFNLPDGANLETMSLSEDKDFGYTFYANLREGMANISQNWRNWPNPYKDCGSDDCYKKMRIKDSDILSDDEVIVIADQFLKEYGIDADVYGEPQINKSWEKQWLIARENGRDYYLPENMTVVYPLMIDGEIVYDQSGNPFGLMVSVSNRFDKVVNVNNLMTNHYLSSVYDLIQDKDKFMTVLSRGGSLYPSYYKKGDGVEEQVIKLDTPEKIKMKVYNNSDGISEELIVPALSFPIIEDENSKNLWRDSIVIPLLDEMLQLPDGDSVSPTPLPMPEPMPLIR